MTTRLLLTIQFVLERKCQSLAKKKEEKICGDFLSGCACEQENKKIVHFSVTPEANMHREEKLKRES